MPKYIETSDDYRLKYEGCYTKLSDDYKLPPDTASVIKFSGNFTNGKDGIASAYLYSKTKSNLTSAKEGSLSFKSINLEKLKLGALNLDKSVIVLKSKVPHDSGKYKQLPHSTNLKLVDPFEVERDILELRHPSTIDDYFILKAWGDQKFFPAVDALDFVVNHDRLGCAFSNQYFFGISYAGDCIFLFKDGFKIARVNSRKEILLKPQIHCLEEQLSEFGLKVKRIVK